jgi:hypothetical protein
VRLCLPVCLLHGAGSPLQAVFFFFLDDVRCGVALLLVLTLAGRARPCYQVMIVGHVELPGLCVLETPCRSYHTMSKYCFFINLPFLAGPAKDPQHRTTPSPAWAAERSPLHALSPVTAACVCVLPTPAPPPALAAAHAPERAGCVVPEHTVWLFINTWRHCGATGSNNVRELWCVLLPPKMDERCVAYSPIARYRA